MISIVIPVKNEEGNLPSCLESLRDFDDVVVVDSGSTDNTCQIAKAHGRDVLAFVWDGKYPKKRNWALKNYAFKHEWVLFLDADERMTPAFKEEIERKIKSADHCGFWIGYDNWFMGRLLKHGDPMRKLALFKLGHGQYERIAEESWSSLDMEIHEHVIVDGSVGVLHARLEHHDKRNLAAYYSRHNEYSSWEAMRYLGVKGALQQSGKNKDDVLTSRQKLKYGMMLWKIFPLLYFIGSYLFKRGFLDGREGFYFAIGKMFYFYQIQAKISEKELS